MARVQYGGLVTGLMGSIGGTTFQKNFSGAIARSRSGTNNSSTSKQTQSHINHFYWLAQFIMLSNTNKNLWYVYGQTYTKINKFGETKKLTGLNWYESINYNLTLINKPAVSAPPTHLLPLTPPRFTTDIQPDYMKINLLSPWNFTTNPVIFWCSLPTKRTRKVVNRIRKFMFSKYTETVQVIEFTADYMNATGLPALGNGQFPNNNISICIQSIHPTSGIASPMLCEVAQALPFTEGIGYFNIEGTFVVS